MIYSDTASITEKIAAIPTSGLLRRTSMWTHPLTRNPQRRNQMSDTPKADKAADSGLRLTTCCASSIAIAALEFANSRAELLAAKQSRNSHKCQNEWRDPSGCGESEPPCRFEENLGIEEMCEPCRERLKANEIVQAKSKAASKAWRRFKAISSHNAKTEGPPTTTSTETSQ